MFKSPFDRGGLRFYLVLLVLANCAVSHLPFLDKASSLVQGLMRGQMSAQTILASLPLIILGTAIIILINQPVPACPPFVSSRLSQAGLGMFTLLGAVRPGASAAGRSFRLWWIDGTIAIAAVLVVRILVFGITL